MAGINYAEIFGQNISFDELELQEAKDVAQCEVSDEAKAGEAAVLDKYQKLLDDGEFFNFTFSGVAKKSSLFSYESGVRIMMPASIMNDDTRKKVLGGWEGRNELVGVPILVRVSSIKRDGEHGPIVFLRNTVSSKEATYLKAKAARNALNIMVDSKDKTRVPARVISVDLARRLITLDIGGYGIRAYCKADDWGSANITDVTLGTIAPGSIVGVRVVAKPMWRNDEGIPVSKSKAGAYRCIRVSDAPYKGLAGRFPVGTLVVARLEKQFDAYGFYAIDGVNDVHVMCYHPWFRDGKKENKTGITKVYEGVVYRIHITEVDEAKKLFRGRVIGVVGPKDDVTVGNTDTK